MSARLRHNMHDCSIEQFVALCSVFEPANGWDTNKPSAFTSEGKVMLHATIDFGGIDLSLIATSTAFDTEDEAISYLELVGLRSEVTA